MQANLKGADIIYI